MAFRERFVTDYLDPLQAEKQIGEIVCQFPDLCRLEELPYLSHGYEGQKVEARGRHAIKVLYITAPGGAQTRPAVLLMRSHHAREWINAMAVIETARQLVENYRPDDPDPRVQANVRTLQSVEYLIIPESNPDGARLSFFDEGRRLWRKNLRPPINVGGCPGVDCNRNFPQFWGEAGSSPEPCSDIYRGQHALSEPEAANIAFLVERERNIVFAIDSHSEGQSIFRPSPAGGTFISNEPVSPEDDDVYKHLEGEMNAAIQTVQGIEYKTGSTSNHAGTTDEFFFFVHRIFGFDLECGNDFQPPVADAILASLEVAAATRALGLCATGETGLPIEEFLARRQAVPQDSLALDEMVLEAGTWNVERQAVEHWRRFLLWCEPLPGRPVLEQYQDLAGQGFDVSLGRERDVLEIIASAAELTALLRRGYQPVVRQDLIAGLED
jgi:hypothetical protein